jgi:hypothetical protein
MGLSDLSSDRQAEAATSGGPVSRMISPPEPVEDLRKIGGRDPEAGVRDRNGQHTGGESGSDEDCPIRSAVPNCVRQQDSDQLAQAYRIYDHLRVAGVFDTEAHAGRLGIRAMSGDTDHLGFAERLRRDHAVPVHVHEADAARARGEITSKPSFGPMKLRPTAGFFWYAMRKGGLRTTYLSEVVTVEDGQILDLPGSPRIVGLPGH